MLYEELGLSLAKPEVISVVGAGGKTSLINALSRELKSLNKKVLSTTTTHILRPRDVDYFFLEKIKDDFIPRKGTITSYGSHLKDGKLVGKTMGAVDALIRRKIFDYTLIEADGSKGKPLKAPEKHEPVITSLSTMTIGVIGLDAIGQVLNDTNFHRAKQIGKITEKTVGEEMHIEDIVRILCHKEGTFKDSVGRKVLVLNKADTTQRIMAGKNIRDGLLDKERNIHVLICNINTKEFF